MAAIAAGWPAINWHRFFSERVLLHTGWLLPVLRCIPLNEFLSQLYQPPTYRCRKPSKAGRV